MPLTVKQRKQRLWGVGKEVAKEVGLSNAYVSAVLNGKVQILSKDKVRIVRRAIAAKIGEPVEEVFGTSAAA
jgi:predicted metallopeptidase